MNSFSILNATNTSFASMSGSASNSILDNSPNDFLPPPPPGGGMGSGRSLLDQFIEIKAPLLEFNFTTIVESVISRATSLAKEVLPFSFTAPNLNFLKNIGKMDVLPYLIPPTIIQCYMFGRGGSQKGAFGFTSSGEENRKSEVLNPDLFEAPSEQSSAASAADSEAPTTQVQMRKKTHTTPSQQRASAQRLSLLCGVKENHPMIQGLASVIDGTGTDEEIIRNVATLYGFPEEKMAKLLKQGMTLRNTIIAELDISPEERNAFLANQEWEGQDAVQGSSARASIRQSVLERLQVFDPSEVEQLKKGAEELGLDLNTLTAEELETLDERVIQSKIVERATSFFDTNNISGLYSLLRKTFEFETKARAIIQKLISDINQLKEKLKETSDKFSKSSLHSEIEELESAKTMINATRHEDIIVQLYNHVALKIRSGESYINHQLFQNLISDPKYAKLFANLEKIDIEQITSAKLGQKERKVLEKALKDFEDKFKKELSEASDVLKATHAVEKNELIKKEQGIADSLILDQLMKRARERVNSLQISPEDKKQFEEELMKLVSDYQTEKTQMLKELRESSSAQSIDEKTIEGLENLEQKYKNLTFETTLRKLLIPLNERHRLERFNMEKVFKQNFQETKRNHIKNVLKLK